MMLSLRATRSSKTWLFRLSVLFFILFPCFLSAQNFYSVAFFNLDPDAGKLLVRATFRNGEQIATSEIGFGGQTTGTAFSEEGPIDAWIAREDGSRYVEHITLTGGVTQVVALREGAAKVWSSLGGSVLYTSFSKQTFRFRELNGRSDTVSSNSGGSVEIPIWMNRSGAALSFEKNIWWILRTSTMPFIVRANDTTVVGQAGPYWAIRVDPQVDSAGFRLVNLAAQGRASLEIESGGSLTAEPLAVTQSLPTDATVETKRLRVRLDGTLLLDTAITIYPFMQTDVVVGPGTGQFGGSSVLLSERLTSQVGSGINGYWKERVRFVLFPTGSLMGSTLRLRDSGIVQKWITPPSTIPQFREEEINESSGDLTVINRDDDAVALLDLPEAVEDSLVYLFVDRGFGLQLYTYNEFNQGEQTLALASPVTTPTDIPYDVVVASFVADYDTLVVASDDDEFTIHLGSMWNSGRVGPMTGASLLYRVTEPIISGIAGAGPGDQIAAGKVWESPGSYSVILLDDDPKGGVRTVSYPVPPGNSHHRIRLVNFTEGGGAYGLTTSPVVPGIPPEWEVDPVDEGMSGMAVLDKTGERFSLVIRNSSGDSLISYLIPSEYSYMTIILNGGSESGVIQGIGFTDLHMRSPFRMTVTRQFKLPASTLASDNRVEMPRIAPNPARSWLRVEPREESIRISRILLLNTLGQTIREMTIDHTAPSYQLDLEGIPPGQYHILIEQENGDVSGEKVVVE